jgi:hypothetical protein
MGWDDWGRESACHMTPSRRTVLTTAMGCFKVEAIPDKGLHS